MSDTDLSLLMVGMGWPTEQPGGLNTYFAELFASLTKLDPNVRGVVVADDAVPSGIVAIRRSSLLLRLLRNLVVVTRLARGANVVDVHFPLYGFFPTLLGVFRGKRVIVHFQGPWAAESAHASGRRDWTTRAKCLVEKAVYRRADHIIVLSDAFRQLIVRDYGVSPRVVTVLRPGVGQRFFVGTSEQDKRAFVVISVRRLVPRMGLDFLLLAWAKAGIPAGQLLVVGDGPERMALERLSQRLNVEGSVTFLGRVPDSELPDLYARATVAAVPSVALEGFGLVVLEALAAGTPVIGTDVGGLPEILSPLAADLVVSAGDPDALAERLVRASLGGLPERGACRAYARAFDWDAVASAHCEILKVA
jgi:glycosyltransferase involved in cell wall biosynthesis